MDTVVALALPFAGCALMSLLCVRMMRGRKAPGSSNPSNEQPRAER